MRSCAGATGHPDRHVEGTFAAVMAATESPKAGTVVVVVAGRVVEVVVDVVVGVEVVVDVDKGVPFAAGVGGPDVHPATSRGATKPVAMAR